MTTQRHMTGLTPWTFLILTTIMTGAHSVQGADEWSECFRNQCASLYDFCAVSLVKATEITSPYPDLAVLAKGEAVEGAGIKYAIEKMNSRKDCADFDLPAMLWLLYRYQDSPLIDPNLVLQARQCILDFKSQSSHSVSKRSILIA